MIVLYDGQTITLKELAEKICENPSNYENDCAGCEDGSCPAAEYCRHNHNGMVDWLRKVLRYD